MRVPASRTHSVSRSTTSRMNVSARIAPDVARLDLAARAARPAAAHAVPVVVELARRRVLHMSPPRFNVVRRPGGAPLSRPIRAGSGQARVSVPAGVVAAGGMPRASARVAGPDLAGAAVRLTGGVRLPADAGGRRSSRLTGARPRALGRLARSGRGSYPGRDQPPVRSCAGRLFSCRRHLFSAASAANLPAP